MSDFIVGVKKEVRRLRENEESNVRRLKSLHAEILELIKENPGAGIVVEKSSRDLLVLKVASLPPTNIALSVDGQEFTLARGTTAHSSLSFTAMQEVLQNVLAADLAFIEQRSIRLRV